MTGINTLSHNLALRTAIQQLGGEAAKLHRQVSTGQKAETFSEYGPATARRVVSLKNEVGHVDTFLGSIGVLAIRAERVEHSLTRIKEAGTEVRDEALKLGTSLIRPADLQARARAALADTIAQLNPDMSGHFVLAGVNADAPPVADFEAIATGVRAAIAGAVPANDPAAVSAQVEAFFADETNWYRGGDAAPAIDVATNRSAVLPVRANDPGNREMLIGLSTLAFGDPAAFAEDDYASLVESATATLGGAAARIDDATGRNGHLRAELEAIGETHSQVRLLAETELGDLQKVDLFDAISRLQALQTQLQATFSLTGELRRLSLTNYL